jgi:hypothetical protein
MTKQYSVDYWVDPSGSGDPDRSDYSDDQQLLENIALQQRHFDGQTFRKIVLYERTGLRVGDWKPIRQLMP